jgi:hypothetical protein
MESLNRTAVVRAAALACGVLLVAACGTSEDDPPKVATADTVVSVSASNVAAMGTTPFVFSGLSTPVTINGQPGTLNLTGTTTVSISPSAAGGSPTFSIGNGGGSATGSMSFGSCIFEVAASNLPGVPAGTRLTVNPCLVNIATGGLRATGVATNVQILLQLGLIPSRPNQAAVTIDPATGVVVVNNVNTGVSVTLNLVTGST